MLNSEIACKRTLLPPFETWRQPPQRVELSEGGQQQYPYRCSRFSLPRSANTPQNEQRSHTVTGCAVHHWQATSPAVGQALTYFADQCSCSPRVLRAQLTDLLQLGAVSVGLLISSPPKTRCVQRVLSYRLHFCRCPATERCKYFKASSGC